MTELSKEFKVAFLSGLLRAMRHPGESVALQEGDMQFPGTPPMWIKYVAGPPDMEGGLIIYFGKDKTPGDWTQEARIPLEAYISAGGPGGEGGGVIAGLLRDSVPDTLQGHDRYTSSHGLVEGHFAINGHYHQASQSHHMRLSFHKDDAEKIAAHIAALKERIAAGEGHAQTIRIGRESASGTPRLAG